MTTTTLAKHHQMMVEDGAPVGLCRAPATATATRAASGPETTPEPAGGLLSPEERAIRDEAARRWRGWTASAKELSRPALRTFVKRVRDQRRREEKLVKADQNKATKPMKTKTPKAPAKPEPKQQEKTMLKKRTAKTKKAARASARTPMKESGTGPRAGTKTEAVAKLLMRSEGTTTAEVLKATGWPAVSMPQQAKAAGLKLRKEKVKGEPTRYWGAAA